MACVMIAKYTPPTRRLNIASPMMKAKSVGTSDDRDQREAESS